MPERKSFYQVQDGSLSIPRTKALDPKILSPLPSLAEFIRSSRLLAVLRDPRTLLEKCQSKCITQ